jgi:hypothetical protein
MNRFVRDALLAVVLIATSLVMFAPDAGAVPSYTRRYGFACSSCHTMWGALNPAGVTFRLSGYRAMFGKDLIPIEEGHDIDIPGVNVKITNSLPFSFVTGTGFDYRTEKRTSFTGATTTRTGSTLALEDASIFLTSPVGQHFSAFVEFPMYETRAWEFTPTGPSGARADGQPGGANDMTAARQFQFGTEKPIFEVAKFWWNNLLGDTVQRDAVNALVGITHLPLAYSPGKVRLSVNQYPIYERRAMELISPFHPSLMGLNDGSFRLSEPQGIAELNGMVVPTGNVTDSAKRETLWFEYHAGVTNGSQDAANNNNSFGGYGRLVGRYYGQSLGVFGFYKPDIYDDMMRTDPNFVLGGNIINTGVFNPLAPQASNAAAAVGVDGTLSLAPWGVPLSLDNQYMWRSESNPTGFNTRFNWQGGFHQLNWFARPDLVVYARYDWIRGNTFNDTFAGGITYSDPREWDVVAGIQYALWENVKFVGEFRHHRFEDHATGAFAANMLQPFLVRTNVASITDDGFTARVMMGF